MTFEHTHSIWLEGHCNNRSGERLRRLEDGHGHAEILFLKQVWWPLIEQFEHLHPEYEVKDFRDGTRFIDFAYLRSPYRVAIEIDGYGPHARDIDRTRFADNLMRQNQLIVDGWKVLRFSYDDLTQNAKRCQQLLLQLLGRLYGTMAQSLPLAPQEKEIIRLALHTLSPLTPAAVATHLDIRRESAIVWLKRLQAKELLQPASGQARVRAYLLTTTNERLLQLVDAK